MIGIDYGKVKEYLHRLEIKKKNLLSTHYTKSVPKTDHSTPKSHAYQPPSVITT
jgi:hypothetical protein